MSEVLTDVGTNELEVVEFRIDDQPYGINVGKVREIIRPVETMAVPESHPCVMGVFRNRDDVIPLVDLGWWLGSATQPDPRHVKVIVAEFNRMKVGFLVHRVARIHRTSWDRLEKADPGGLADSPSNLGLIRIPDDGGGERIVFLLDFERIVDEMVPRKSAPEVPGQRIDLGGRTDKVVLMVEDSSLARKMIRQRIEGGGYRVVVREDGLAAWETLVAGEAVDLVITDIEMPRMDGHTLTRKIKEHEALRHLPVVLYSSMIYDEMRRKGESVGADAQLCKPDLPRLLETIDRLLLSE